MTDAELVVDDTVRGIGIQTEENRVDGNDKHAGQERDGG